MCYILFFSFSFFPPDIFVFQKEKKSISGPGVIHGFVFQAAGG